MGCDRLSEPSHRDDPAAWPCSERRALVVFENRTEGGLLRLLRPGFRHCFCLVADGAHWIVCDPLKSRVELTIVTSPNEGVLADQLARPGRTVLRGQIRSDRAPRPPRLRPVTCVETVMRILNVDAAGVLTPYQLFRHLLGPLAADRGFATHHDRRAFALDGDVK